MSNDVSEHSEHPDCLLETAEDIYGALRKLVLMQKPVRVHIDGSDQTYSADVTHTDFKSRSFFISDLHPANGTELIRQGHRFRIDCDHQGVYIGFRADGRLRYQPDEHRFRAEFPSQITYRQRRAAYRVAVPSAHRLQVSLPLTDQSQCLVGQLLDLSESGFKARFSGDQRQLISHQHLFPAAVIRFNEDHHMDCELEARHLLLTEQGETLCGFVFSLISSQAQRYIRKLITDFQWEERERRQQRQQSTN